MEWHASLGPRPGAAAASTSTGRTSWRTTPARRSTSSSSSPFGWQEIEGIHNRGDFDLGRHQEYSGKKLEYFDQATNERYLPYVVETSAGADRVDARRAGERLPRGGGRGRDPRRARPPSRARADQGRRLPAGEEGRHAGVRRPSSTTTSSGGSRRSTTTAAPSAGATGGRTRSARRSASRSTADTLSDRHGDGPRTATRCSRSGWRWTRSRTTSRRGLGRERPEACASPTSKPWSAAWPTRFPASFCEGIAEITVSPRTVPHPDAGGHLHPGRVHSAPGRRG